MGAFDDFIDSANQFVSSATGYDPSTGQWNGGNIAGTAFQTRNPFRPNSPFGASAFDFFNPHQDPSQSFVAQVAKPGAAKPFNSSLPPTQQDAANLAMLDAEQRQQRIRSASTILTGGAGLLDAPVTYSASRSLLGS